MNINNSTHDIFVRRNIRRFPSELDQVPSRNTEQAVAVGRKQIYAEVASDLEGAKGASRAANFATKSPATTGNKPFSLWEKEGFGVCDLIDMINPLHHIPVMATIYRNLSGDQIGAASRVIGGAIWGRIGGLVGGLANAVVEWWSGKDIGDHVYAAVFGDPKKNESTAIVHKAASTPTASPSSTATTDAPASGERIVISGDADFDLTSTGREMTLRARGSDVSASLPSSAYMALASYERHRRQGAPDESLGIRLPV
jgi:hypothetical protein